MADQQKPESLKCKLTAPKRIRQFGQRELRIYPADSIVELPYEEALYLIAGQQADGIEDDAKVSKGLGQREAPPKAAKGKGE